MAPLFNYREGAMPAYIKPNGSEIEINEQSIPYALSIGWVPKPEHTTEESDLEFLRAKYFTVTGNRAHHKLKEAALLRAIENGNS